MYMDNIKDFAQKEERIGNSNTSCEYIQLGHKDGIWQRNMYYAYNEKRKTTKDGRNLTNKSRKITTPRKKESYKYLKYLKQTQLNMRRLKIIKKECLRRTRNYSKQNYKVDISSKG